MNWLAQYFFHPAFVIPGAALVAAPIIIHLINRLRFRKVRFAAMEFLFQSRQRNRRRLLIEQLILLAARIAIVLLITVLIARLVLDPAQMSLFRGAQTHHVVLLDDSASMREEIGEGTA
ncbi:MAG: BatA domain-containing protein, partial [Planctomycetaceae bacterium]